MAISIVSSNLALARSLTIFIAASMRIELVAVDALHGGFQTFSLSHRRYSSTVRPMERAEPAMIFSGLLNVVGVQVLQLRLGDLANLIHRHGAGGSAACRCEPVVIFAAFFRK